MHCRVVRIVESSQCRVVALQSRRIAESMHCRVVALHSCTHCRPFRQHKVQLLPTLFTIVNQSLSYTCLYTIVNLQAQALLIINHLAMDEDSVLTNDLDCSSDDSGDDDELDDELVERQLLEEHSLSGPLISEPVTSEPIASESVASEPIASEPCC